MIVECTGYERERNILVNEAKDVFGNDIFEIWHAGESKSVSFMACVTVIIEL